jgi:hypothetical protein
MPKDAVRAAIFSHQVAWLDYVFLTDMSMKIRTAERTFAALAFVNRPAVWADHWQPSILVHGQEGKFYSGFPSRCLRQ